MERSNLAEAYSGECEAPNAPGRVPILGPGKVLNRRRIFKLV